MYVHTDITRMLLLYTLDICLSVCTNLHSVWWLPVIDSPAFRIPVPPAAYIVGIPKKMHILYSSSISFWFVCFFYLLKHLKSKQNSENEFHSQPASSIFPKVFYYSEVR